MSEIKEKKINWRWTKNLTIMDASTEAKVAVTDFKRMCIGMRDTASKKTHYQDLNQWSDVVFGYVHKMLKKTGFKNGRPEENAKNPSATLWWAIYGVVGNITYSPYLKTEVARHHSSAWERNEALIKELQDLTELLA